MKNFLEGIGYVGFANFDMKYDHRDGTYKLFEMNLRQGRSSYYVTAAGYNLAKWLVDDVLYHKDMPCTVATNKVLWTIIPEKIIFQYVKSESAKAEARALSRRERCATLITTRGTGPSSAGCTTRRTSSTISRSTSATWKQGLETSP